MFFVLQSLGTQEAYFCTIVNLNLFFIDLTITRSEAFRKKVVVTSFRIFILREPWQSQVQVKLELHHG